MTRRTRRSVGSVAGLVAASALIAASAATVGAETSGRATSGTAYVAITHVVGSVQYAAGNARDKILGTGAITYTIKLGTGSQPGTIKVIAKPVTIFTKTGTLSGTATATATVAAGTGVVTFSDGKLNLSNGTGGQKGHSLRGTFTGIGKSATGPFVFRDKGIYR